MKTTFNTYIFGNLTTATHKGIGFCVALGMHEAQQMANSRQEKVYFMWVDNNTTDKGIERSLILLPHIQF